MSEHLAIVAVMAAVLSLGCSNDKGETQFKITTKRDNDSVQIEVAKSKGIFSVQSPFGIGQVIIETTDENWPDTVLLHLHLKGLENFKVSNGEVTLEASVSSQDGPARLWKDGKEDLPLDSRSPYWMEIRRIGNDGRPTTTIPLEAGYFEINLPKALLEDNPKSITVSWIDFYR
jgi:hypothetical protein